MDSIANLIDFVNQVVSSVTSFTDAVFNFMTYKIPALDITTFEAILGSGVAVYLTASITKWLVGIVT